MMKPDALTKADFITGLVISALGIAVVAASLAMPTFAERNVNPYTVPGIVPGVLGVVLTVLGAALVLRAARAGGWRLGASGAAAQFADPGWRRLGLAVLLTVGYAAGLVGWLPFWLATFIFVVVFIMVFEWPLAQTGKERLIRSAYAVVIAALLSAAVSYVFQEIFLVRLP